MHVSQRILANNAPARQVSITRAGELRRLAGRISSRRYAPALAGTLAVTVFLALTAGAVYAAGMYSGIMENMAGRALLAFGVCFSILEIGAAGLALWSYGSLLSAILGILPEERRFLALNLPQNFLQSIRWGKLSRRWLYHGNCLFATFAESPRGYVHVFNAGEHSEGIKNDIELWKRVAKILPPNMRTLCNPGKLVRQAQQVPTLPRWSSYLEGAVDGYALCNVLDGQYETWARNFLATAGKKLSCDPALLDFFLVRADENGMAALVVCVLPRGEAVSSILRDAGSARAA